MDDLRKILHGGQRMAKVHSDEEISPKVLNPEEGTRTLRTDGRQSRQTDRFAIANTGTSRSHVRVKICALKEIQKDRQTDR